MLTTFAVFAVALFPIVSLVLLLELVAWRDRQLKAAVARQIALTDAIAGELGAIVAPVVKKPLWGPWQVEIAVPFARPATVGTILSIAHRVFSFAERMSPGRYRIVLTPQEEPARRETRAVTRAPRAEAA